MIYRAYRQSATYSALEYELLNQLNTFYNSYAPVWRFQIGAFCILGNPSKVFEDFSKSATNSCYVGSYCAERGSDGKQPSPTLTQKGGEKL